MVHDKMVTLCRGNKALCFNCQWLHTYSNYSFFINRLTLHIWDFRGGKTLF